MIKQRDGHIVELQSVRGIAAMAVLIGHALNYYTTPGLFVTLQKLFNGRAAVVIFFILSGFVITRSLAKSRLTMAHIFSYYVRRAARIYPAIWFASILGLGYLLFLHWNIPVEGASEHFRNRLFLSTRMDPLHILASFAGLLAFVLPQLWSITIEIFASILMPFIAYCAYLRSSALLWLLSATLLISFTLGAYPYYYFGLYLVDFVIGAAICVLPTVMVLRLNRMNLSAKVALVALAVFLTTTQYFFPSNYYHPVAHLMESLSAAGVICLIVYSSTRVNLLRTRIALFLGDISYSIYLLHFVVLCTLAKFYAVVLPMWGLSLSPISLSILLAISTVVLTIPLSWLSYQYVELTGIAVGKRLLKTQWMQRQPALPALAQSVEIAEAVER